MVIRSDQQSEHSRACCHDGMCLWRHEHLSLSVLVPLQTHATAADTCCHGSWLTDDLNPYSISWVTCSRPSLETRTSWLQHITNVTPLICVSIYHYVTIKYTNHSPNPTAKMFECKFNIELQATTGSQDDNLKNNNENDSTLTNRDNSASAGSITIPALQHQTWRQ